MSNRYKGGVLSATPPTTSSSAAPGIWTLEQQMQATAGTGWPFGGPFTYIEDVFSTWLYTGNSSTQTITNGINLSANGGLVWSKDRADGSHWWIDTIRGRDSFLVSNNTNGQTTGFNGNIASFNSNGYSLTTGYPNTNTANYVSWTFREQAKFFDIVTYTGTGGARTINHNLGSAAGCIMIKCTSTTSNWMVWHTSISGQNNLYLNSTAGTSGVAADPISVNGWPSSPSTTTFNVDAGTDSCNTVGETYVAYLFATNAGGFGLTGNDNVITCGSYTGIAYPTSLDVNVGFEPQWVMIKNATTASGWTMWDVMRGMAVVPAINTAQAQLLEPNTAAVESIQPGIYPTATGFVVKNGLTAISGSGDTMIYIAIRRGPMKVPTVGTTVFSPIARTGTGAIAQITGVGFPPDLAINAARTRSASTNTQVTDRLRGTRVSVFTNRTDGDLTYTNAITAFGSDGETLGTDATQGAVNVSGSTYINWLFGRAPGFFDEVCYTGNGTAGLSVSHNLTVPPEMVIVKRRDSTGDWPVLMRNVDRLGSAGSSYRVNSTASWDPAGVYFSDSSGTFVPATDATSTVFKVSNATAVNASAGTYVAYLFATCAGVSKVGSYTGTGTTLQVNCGFTAGSRFVLIKRADASGDWYVWDSARGIVSGNDPYLLLNDTAAEVTGTDYVDTYNAGFELSSTAPAGLNANGGTYIFLAIA